MADQKSMTELEAMEPSPLRLLSSASVDSQTPLNGAPDAGPDGTKKSSRGYYLGKFLVICIVLVVSYYFQAASEAPLKVDYHQTDDPHNFESRGYTCGCDLPYDGQELLYKRRAASSPFNLNVCYDPSALKDLNILVFSNSSAELVESTMGRKAHVNKTMQGSMIEEQAHAITGPLNSFDASAQPLDLKSLYPGGRREGDVGATEDYFLSTTFLSFPKDYLRLAFTYCNKRSCTKDCGIEDVNQIFNSTLNTERWGGCFPVDTNECNQSIYSYQAKCTIYPTTTVRTVFNVKRFLEELQKKSNIGNISAPLVWGTFWSDPEVKPNITIEASTVYMNNSKVIPSQVLLRFEHVEPQSAAWLDLLRLFPSMDSSCSSFNTTVCTGASLCNLFSNGGSPDIRCLDQSVLQSASSCKKILEGSTLENADGLCGDLGMTPEDYHDHCPCREQVCHTNASYLATWNISQYLKEDPLNAFLYSGILKDDWAKRSGLCTSKYPRVIPYNPGANDTADEAVYEEKTIILEGSCSEGRMGSSEYCWLTGRYRNFTDSESDLNDTKWKVFNDTTVFYNDSKLGGRFACYQVSRQRTYVWILLTFGAAFGWAGSIDLLFKFLEWFGHEYKEYRKYRKDVQESVQERKTRKADGASPSSASSFSTMNSAFASRSPQPRRLRSFFL